MNLVQIDILDYIEFNSIFSNHAGEHDNQVLTLMQLNAVKGELRRKMNLWSNKPLVPNQPLS